MDKDFLIRLIMTSPRVVIPGFGAFLKKQKDGYPVFTPFLKSDDGFLSSEIESEYGVQSSDAKEIIESYVEHIKEVLSERRAYVIDGVGILRVNDNGAITLLMDTTKQIPKSSTSAPAQIEEAEEVKGTGTPPPTTQRTITPQPIMGSRPQFNTQPPRPAAAPAQPAPQNPPQPAAQSNRGPAVPPTPRQQPSGFVRQSPPQPQTQAAPQPKATPRPAPAGTKRASEEPRRRPAPNQEYRESTERYLRDTPPAKKKKRSDVWLIIAIIAATLVIGMMILGILTAQEVQMIE